MSTNNDLTTRSAREIEVAFYEGVVRFSRKELARQQGARNVDFVAVKELQRLERDARKILAERYGRVIVDGDA